MKRKIQKSLKALWMIFRKPYLLNLILDENLNWKEKVERKHPGSDKLPMISLEQLFGNFEETLQPFLFLDGGSLPTDLALLKHLASSTTNCRYFEIGTWRGESVANISPVAASCITLDLTDEEKKAAGMNRAYISEYAILSLHLSNVTHIRGNSFHFDFASLNQKFDLVFIDGDHHYDAVLNDTMKVLKDLCHEKTIIVWHDYAYNPEKIRYEVLSAILDGVPEKMHSQLFHVGNTLCAIYHPGFQPPKNPASLSAFEVRLSIQASQIFPADS